MNIFVLDYNQKLAAEYHCDKHVVKMILETAQLLSSVHHYYETGLPGIYKKTHINHPCAVWTRKNRENYLWTLNLGRWLLYEYEKRYKRVHKTSEVMDRLIRMPKTLPYGPLSPFVQAMPEIYQRKDAVEAYRTYYMAEKSPICTWKTQVPWWFTYSGETLPSKSILSTNVTMELPQEISPTIG